MTPHVRVADWNNAHDQRALRRIRQQVFIDEQRVPVELEWDGQDTQALHFLAEKDSLALGCARLLRHNGQGAQIGRMAVLPAYRGQGIGAALMQSVLNQATTLGITQLFLHAQVPVIGFYQRFGFVAEGEIFLDAGIRHRTMRRKCAK